MSLPQSDTRDLGPTAVLIPLRSLSEGKLRLSSVYDEGDRAQLIESMASTVLRAAHDLDVFIVHDSPTVASWAQERGAKEFRPRQPGLNRAVSEGRDHLRELGYARMIVAHADLPHATDLRPIDTGDGIAIVSDRHDDGTNVLCLPTDVDFTFAYGPGSFDSHLEIARRLGLEPIVIEDASLSWDVDHPDDLIGSSLEQFVHPDPTKKDQPT